MHSEKLKYTRQKFHTVVNKELLTDLQVENVDEGTSRAVDLRQLDAALGVVIENRVLTAPGVPEKRHIGKSSRRRVIICLMSVQSSSYHKA